VLAGWACGSTTGGDMAEQRTSPGTANVSPADRAKLAPLLKHYRAQPKPWTACYADQLKHGLSPSHAAARCAVIKDLALGTTSWRKGGRHKKLSASGVDRVVELAGKVPKKVKVRNAKGTVFERTIYVNPDQIQRATQDAAKRAGKGVKAPGKTSDHGKAGLRRLGKNVYVDGKGKTFKRAGAGKDSKFVPLSPREAKVVKGAVKKAVAAKGFGKVKPVTPTKPAAKATPKKKAQESPLSKKESDALRKSIRQTMGKKGKRKKGK